MKKGLLKRCFKIGYEYEQRRLDLLDNVGCFSEIQKLDLQNGRRLEKMPFFGQVAYVCGIFFGNEKHDSLRFVDNTVRDVLEKSYDNFEKSYYSSLEMAR